VRESVTRAHILLHYRTSLHRLAGKYNWSTLRPFKQWTHALNFDDAQYRFRLSQALYTSLIIMRSIW